MKNLHCFAMALLAVTACGDDKKATDAPKPIDSPNPDGLNIPTPPTPGAQIDRMGRPAINTALNHTFDLSAAGKGSAKDAYNQDGGAGTWTTTYVTEFAKNLAMFDALDMGLKCTAGSCSGSAAAQGCGNQVLYNGSPSGGGSAMACPGATCSYNTLATVMADDQLYLDTSKSMCQFFLAVEFGYVTGLGNETCGGRAPAYDVIDFSYTALATGINGFTTGTFLPAFGDNVGPHTDYLTDFPYLGPPHNN